MIVQLNVVLNRTVVFDSDWCFDNLFGSHLQSESELYHASWWFLTLVIDLIDKLSRDVIGRLSVKPWCYWLWRLVMSLMCFDPSIVTIKQSFIVNQIVSCPVVHSWLVLHDPTNKSYVRRFHEHLDGQNADIQLTKEIEETGIMLFLDCLVTHDNNRLRTTNYRNPTHTDRLLDQSSFNPTSHKATTIRTWTRRAQLVCDSPDNLQDETDYLNNVFSKKLQRRLCYTEHSQ